jgi:hypothetical protein
MMGPLRGIAPMRYLSPSAIIDLLVVAFIAIVSIIVFFKEKWFGAFKYVPSNYRYLVRWAFLILSLLTLGFHIYLAAVGRLGSALFVG